MAPLGGNLDTVRRKHCELEADPAVQETGLCHLWKCLSASGMKPNSYLLSPALGRGTGICGFENRIWPSFIRETDKAGILKMNFPSDFIFKYTFLF